MKVTNLAIGLVCVLSLAACEGYGDRTTRGDKTIDRGDDAKNLSELQAGIWVDPRGCQHWIIDDGVEGYLSARLDPHTGKPVCRGVVPPGYATGDFKGGSDIADPV